MADSTITALPAKTTPAGTEETVLNDSGTDKKMTLSNIMKLVPGRVTAATIDLSGAAYTTVIDDDVADTLIAATAKPGSPQYTKTVATLPTDITDVQDYMVFFTIGGKNTDAGTARTINCIMTRNGVEVGSTTSVPVGASQFWYVKGYLSGVALVANDVIGMKMWGSLTNVLDYRYATLYLVPRNLVSTLPGFYIVGPATSGPTMVLTGAIAGVTYVNNGINNPTLFDTILGNTVLPSFPGYSVIAAKGQNLSIWDTIAHATTDVLDTPVAQAGSGLSKLTLTRYIRKSYLS